MIAAASMLQRIEPGMGEPDEPDSPSSSERGLGRWLPYFVPPLVVGAFALALIAEPPPADVDLMLLAPDHALPGATLPLRALAMAGVAAEAGPTEALTRPIQVVLQDESGRRFDEASLSLGVADTFEGEVTLPPDAQGELSLIATTTARAGGEVVRVERHVRVSTDAPRSARVGRLATPAQRWRPQAIEAVDGNTPPGDLDLRVLGGACTPELSCELRLWVGEPAASVVLDASPGISVRAASATAPAASAGIVPWTITVQGAEAIAHVTASRQDAVVARRAVRLPILMAGHAMRLPDGSVLRAPAHPEFVVESLDDARQMIVDVYRDGYWTHTETVALDGDGHGRLDHALGPGLWRLQAHTDPTSTLRSAGRLLLVLEPGVDVLTRLRRLAASPALNAGTDPLANLLASGAAAPGTPEQTAELLFALPELDFHQAPELAHGILQLSPDVDPGRRALRALAGGLVLFAGFLIAWILIRRGQAAGHQADLLLAEAEREVSAQKEGERDASIVYAHAPKHASRALLASAAFVVIVFALAALLVVSRGCMS